MMDWRYSSRRSRRLSLIAERFEIRFEANSFLAEIVKPHKVPKDVITMRSKARLRDLDTGREMVYSLVFPDEADSNKGKISILAPVGTAMIGYGTGDIIE